MQVCSRKCEESLRDCRFYAMPRTRLSDGRNWGIPFVFCKLCMPIMLKGDGHETNYHLNWLSCEQASAAIGYIIYG